MAVWPAARRSMGSWRHYSRLCCTRPNEVVICACAAKPMSDPQPLLLAFPHQALSSLALSRLGLGDQTFAAHLLQVVARWLQRAETSQSTGPSDESKAEPQALDETGRLGGRQR